MRRLAELRLFSCGLQLVYCVQRGKGKELFLLGAGLSSTGVCVCGVCVCGVCVCVCPGLGSVEVQGGMARFVGMCMRQCAI